MTTPVLHTGQSFNTFDAIFQTVRLRLQLVVPEFPAGIGYASVNFDYDDPKACAQVPRCPSTHHFLGNAGVAAQWYLSHHVFCGRRSIFSM